jgi:hypothetical protein
MKTEHTEAKTVTEPSVGSSDLFGYFAAHAPEIPEWFAPKKWDQRITVPARDISPSHVRWGSKHCVEEPMAHLVRWRMTYAAAMVAALPNVPDEPRGK